MICRCLVYLFAFLFALACLVGWLVFSPAYCYFSHQFFFPPFLNFCLSFSLYKMKLGEVITTIPTIGFNVETVQYKALNMTVWDVGGQTKIRPLWKYYYQNTNAVIYVCDSTDEERFAEAKAELHSLLQSVCFRLCLLALNLLLFFSHASWLSHNNTLTHTHMHSYTHALIHTCTHARMHTCTHTHIHALTHSHVSFDVLLAAG